MPPNAFFRSSNAVSMRSESCSAVAATVSMATGMDIWSTSSTHADENSFAPTKLTMTDAGGSLASPFLRPPPFL